jgi:hypothetical protein
VADVEAGAGVDDGVPDGEGQDGEAQDGEAQDGEAQDGEGEAEDGESEGGDEAAFAGFVAAYALALDRGVAPAAALSAALERGAWGPSPG